jgi:hypothetical protein
MVNLDKVYCNKITRDFDIQNLWVSQSLHVILDNLRNL